MPKIVRFHETGGPEVLQLEELPPSEPGQGEVRLKVEAIGLNRAEIMFRKGQYLETPQLPSRIGYEAAGLIDAVGPDITEFRIGDRVSTIPSFPMGQYGVYGESAIVPAYAAAKYPDTLSAAEGAAIWMQYMTAFGALIEYGDTTGRLTPPRADCRSRHQYRGGYCVHDRGRNYPSPYERCAKKPRRLTSITLLGSLLHGFFPPTGAKPNSLRRPRPPPSQWRPRM